ncbi:MAG TPA: D-alanine--D-alanine ligase family protein [Phototrophicaceae bacterium]|jgi:D-alanine-D-alanine ligase|nr:D-alanine--D-alanine ligase family protein [Phototrophicaceae bacterium]
MSAKRKTTVAVIFGGRSVEHDVSVVTGNQIMRAFDAERFEIVPIYITRDGRWFTGEALWELGNYKNEITSHKGVEQVILSPSTNHHGLIINPVVGRFQKNTVQRIDVVFPAVHGSHGEDGTLQGLFELADIPYVGGGVLGSAIANDKVITKTILRQHNIPVVPDVMFTRADWLEKPDELIQKIQNTLTYPLFVKPATLGSSIGVGRVNDETMLRTSIEVATRFDRRVLVESAVTDCFEINCAVMGNGNQIEPSVLEQPVSWEQFLTYEEKYMRGNEGMKSAQRLIPAPINPELTTLIKNYAVEAFKAIDGRGTARIDFLVRGNEVYLNEINTMPGSLAFYLWHEVGMTSQQVVEKLVRLAQDAYADKRRSTYDYQTDLISLTARRGLKGVKGTKVPSSVRSTDN